MEVHRLLQPSRVLPPAKFLGPGLLRYLSTLNNLPWLLIEDFNDIMRIEKKVGRVSHLEWLRKGFCEAVRDSGLGDFAFHGYQLTWKQGRRRSWIGCWFWVHGVTCCWK
nr:endonuclease/exonuclease/phosphatase family protein [Ipomoea batatas]